ncbi:MAG: DUF86 domain-containing protein [Synechococcales cyanobacterium RU_4_20]|nr:DUF86 domain-containing protein [Synechococcales cyanobacterium RU_4_20]NJR70008.1 DUF86 domain-containing protein [Synechococcales cyanobacterium CRU_2_2]
MRQPEEENLVYLNDILQCIQDIATYTQAGEAEFMRSKLIRDAIMRNFEVMGEATKRLSSELRQQYPEIPWRRMAGFRDVLIHNYMRIDIATVWNAVQELPPIQLRLESIRQDLINSDS